MKKIVIFALIVFALFAYIFGSLFLMLLIKTDCDLPYNIAFKYLTIPVVLATFILVYNYPRLIIFRGEPKRGEPKTWILALMSLLIGILITMLGGPYISLLNAFIQPQEKVVIEGHVKDKYFVGKYHNVPIVVLDVNNSFGEPYKFEIKTERYDKVQIGNEYKTVMTRGGLGFVYRWN